MGEKLKYPATDAAAVGKFYCVHLSHLANRLIIAGSLRRAKALVSDVEILFIPKFMEGGRADFFSAAPMVNVTEQTIHRLREDGKLKPRPNINGHIAWGELNKLAIDTETGIPVDLFATTEEKWWVSLIIRTGGKQTNLDLTTGAQKMGRKLHAYGVGVEVLRTGEMLIPQSERDVFSFCGVQYREPQDRQ